MERELLAKLDIATSNMSLPVMIALLSRINDQVSEDKSLREVHLMLIRALNILIDEHERSADKDEARNRPN